LRKAFLPVFSVTVELHEIQLTEIAQAKAKFRQTEGDSLNQE
jgi:hypothetical protein